MKEDRKAMLSKETWPEVLVKRQGGSKGGRP